MNLEQVNHITIDGKAAIRLETEDSLLWSGLPTGYTYLDYIEVDGTQYINTGFIPNQDTRIICEYMWFGGVGIYGARYSTGARNFAFRVISSNWQPGYNGKLITTAIKADKTDWHIAEQNKNVFSIDGEVAVEFEYATFTAPKPIILGGINANNAVYYGEGRYRKCKIFDNGVLVRDLVPCINPDNVIGMYDKLNAKFYRNSGTGEFVAGSKEGS